MPSYYWQTHRACVPAWVNWGRVRKIYTEAKRLTQLTGRAHHVDHIVPLRSPFVCGLHCEDNLRIVLAHDNRRKGNGWPEQEYLELPDCLFEHQLKLNL